MTLDQFLKENKMTQVAFAKKIGVCVMQVKRWRNYGVIPHKKNMERIKRVTGGVVRPEDFFDV